MRNRIRSVGVAIAALCVLGAATLAAPAGAENLSRRGEDDRFHEQRPAAARRREIQESMEDRGENETRADVARRIDRPDEYGVVSYEIGSDEDPDVAPATDEADWAEDDPGE